MIELIHGDCMDLMRGAKDKQWDLAIVDPPYGLGEDGASNHSRNKAFGRNGNFGVKNTKKTIVHAKQYLKKKWDAEPPSPEYFSELRRTSRNQIIFGANHFISRLPIDSSCWIVWDKDNGESHFSDCELAWTSFDTAVRKFKWRWNGMLQEKMGEKEEREHPTQKPIGLYRWILKTYANHGDKILDTHLGSGSIAIACHDYGYDLTATEIDADYFKAAQKRLRQHQAQTKLFQ